MLSTNLKNSPKSNESSPYGVGYKPFDVGLSFYMEHYKNLSINDLPNEIWKDVINFEGMYKISSLGRVKSLARKIEHHNNNTASAVPRDFILKQQLIRGYPKTVFSKDSKQHTFFVHRLVGTHWIPNPDNKPFINHKDCVKHNNIPENLEWCTQKENVNHAYANKLMPQFPALINGYVYNVRKILQMDLNENIIKEWGSLSEAQKHFGFKSWVFQDADWGKKEIKTYKGYKWKKL